MNSLIILPILGQETSVTGLCTALEPSTITESIDVSREFKSSIPTIRPAGKPTAEVGSGGRNQTHTTREDTRTLEQGDRGVGARGEWWWCVRHEQAPDARGGRGQVGPERHAAPRVYDQVFQVQQERDACGDLGPERGPRGPRGRLRGGRLQCGGHPGGELRTRKTTFPLETPED